jgi:predicted dehydrogenase
MDIISHHQPHHILVEKPLCTTVQHCKKVRRPWSGLFV